MNIKEAKEQIKNAMTAYFSRDANGRYEIPIDRQRPVFLVGAPGIGKTAIMEQLAEELKVGLVSYSMTHHTRQSALGLPLIVRKKFNGTEFDVSEYTMSEIIASVYEQMEITKFREGILFLDEINCVSETLTPSMLQFLQFKIFGRHRVPDGWIVVTAGNPPEYNKSVREFDIVTMDRLKLIQVEPDFETWKQYAYQKSLHTAVLTYLEIKKNNFYIVETAAEGKHFVTARGWDDLAQMMRLCEKHNIPVDERLIGQYLQHPKIARDFAAYYDLFHKYRSDYQVEAILAGSATDAIKDRARKARFDERVALLGLLLEAAVVQTRAICEEENRLLQLKEQIKAVSGSSGSTLRDDFTRRTQTLKLWVKDAATRLNNLFRFCEEVFPDGQELIILVTDMTINPHCALFISRHGCPGYFAHSRDLLFHERRQEIIEQLDGLDLENK